MKSDVRRSPFIYKQHYICVKQKNIAYENLEAGTFKEMVAAWHSLKSKLEKLQDLCLRKEPDEWLDSKKVCEVLSISSRSLQHLRNNGTLSFTRIDKKIFYRKQDVMSLLTTIQKKK